MTLTVLKPFPHPFRRFHKGDEILETDLVGCVITFDDLKRGKFVADSETKLAEKVRDSVETETVDVETIPVPETATQFERDQIVMAREVDKPLAKR